MNDFLEIGYWRQREARIERVLGLAERLLAADPAEPDDLVERLAAAVAAVREYDAEHSPWAQLRRARSVTAS